MGFISFWKKLDQIWAVFQKSGNFWILDQLANRAKNKKKTVTQNTLVKWLCTNKNNKLMRTLIFDWMFVHKERINEGDHAFLLNGCVQIK